MIAASAQIISSILLTYFSYIPGFLSITLSCLKLSIITETCVILNMFFSSMYTCVVKHTDQSAALMYMYESHIAVIYWLNNI